VALEAATPGSCKCCIVSSISGCCFEWLQEVWWRSFHASGRLVGRPAACAPPGLGARPTARPQIGWRCNMQVASGVGQHGAAASRVVDYSRLGRAPHPHFHWQLASWFYGRVQRGHHSAVRRLQSSVRESAGSAGVVVVAALDHMAAAAPREERPSVSAGLAAVVMPVVVPSWRLTRV